MWIPLCASQLLRVVQTTVLFICHLALKSIPYYILSSYAMHPAGLTLVNYISHTSVPTGFQEGSQGVRHCQGSKIRTKREDRWFCSQFSLSGCVSGSSYVYSTPFLPGILAFKVLIPTGQRDPAAFFVVSGFGQLLNSGLPHIPVFHSSNTSATVSLH